MFSTLQYMFVRVSLAQLFLPTARRRQRRLQARAQTCSLRVRSGAGSRVWAPAPLTCANWAIAGLLRSRVMRAPLLLESGAQFQAAALVKSL